MGNAAIMMCSFSCLMGSDDIMCHVATFNLLMNDALMSPGLENAI